MVLTSERVNKVCNRPTPSKAVALDDPQDGAEPRDGPQEMTENTRPVVDYAASIEKVKDCGWWVFSPDLTAHFTLTIALTSTFFVF